MIKKISLTVILFVFSIFPLFAFASTANPVLNSGFEEVQSNKVVSWNESHWDGSNNTVSFTFDDQYKNSGRRSALIINTIPDDARFEQMIKVEKNVLYKLSCYIRTENVGLSGKGANLSVKGLLDTSRDIKGTSGKWEFVELYGKTGEQQENLVLTLGIGGYGSLNTGKAWFDDVVVEKTDILPSGIKAANLYKEEKTGPNQAGQTVKAPEKYKTSPVMAYAFIMLALSAAGFIYIRRLKKGLIINERLILGVILSAGLLLRFILAPTMEGFSTDITNFKAWAKGASKGLFGIYDSGLFVDYPPFYLYILYPIGKLAAIPFINQNFAFFVKIPPILADIISSYFIYRLALKYLTKEYALLLCASYVFNPALLINSALWGQIDSFFTLIIIIAVYLLKEGKFAASSALFAISVLTKPQGVIFLPILLYDVLKRKNFGIFLKATASGLAATILVIIPFSTRSDPFWIFKLLLKGAAQYPYASLNGFNLFALMGANTKNDSEIPFLFSYNTWGTIFIVCMLALLAIFHFKAKNSSLPFISSLLLLTGTFVLSSRMHERYLFTSILLSLVIFIYIKDKRFYWLYLIFTFTVFINSQVVLYNDLNTHYPHVNPDSFILKFISLLNIVLLVYACKVVYESIILGKVAAIFPGTGQNDMQQNSKLLKRNRLPVFESGEFKITINDIIIMTIMSLAYLILAVVNLGSTKVPQTAWKPVQQGEYFIVDFGRDVALSRVNYYCGLGDGWSAEGKYSLGYLDRNKKTIPLAVIEKKDVFIWKFINIPENKARYYAISTEAPGGELKEMAFFEANSSKPLTGFSIIEEKTAARDGGKVSNLFDEQNTVEYYPSYKTGTYFDEIYHARTAYEHLHEIEPYESTHPPLGKIFISIGVLIFGMNPFGWRIVGTLFGVAMIPLMYLFGKKFFGKSFYGFCTAFLMMFDFMHFSLTRMSTIDVYVTFFIILMFYYMYDYFVNKPYILGYKRSLKPLLLSGLFFGFGAASKWIALYGAAGLALLFFLAKYDEYREYRMLKSKGSSKFEWIKYYKSHYLIRTLLYCVLFFVIIPGAVYILSYIPFMMVPGTGHALKDIIPYQIHMFNYHKNLIATHDFSSKWWEWPLMVRPLWLYAGSVLDQGKGSTITLLGNPAIWWVGIIAVFTSAIISYKKSDRKMAVLFIAIAAQYIPWIFISRIAFIYHFFSIVPFIILSIVYIIKNCMERFKSAKYIVYVYLAIVFILFVVFYPVISGMEVGKSYIESLKWFKSWIF